MSLDDVRRLLKEPQAPEDVVEAVGSVVGVVIALSPVVLGPAAIAALPLLVVKDQLIAFTKRILAHFTKRDTQDYLDRITVMSAANCLASYLAFFEALDRTMPGVLDELKLSPNKLFESSDTLVELLNEQAAAEELSGPERTSPGSSLAEFMLPLPHPLDSEESERGARSWLYGQLRRGLLRVLAADYRRRYGTSVPESVVGSVASLPDEAEAAFQRMRNALAIEFDDFFVWSNLHELGEQTALLEQLSAKARAHYDALLECREQIDVGLARLESLVLVEASAAGREQEQAEVAAELHAIYKAAVEEPVIDDRLASTEGDALVFPSKIGSFIPQAYKALRAPRREQRLEDESVWEPLAAQDDLGPFLLRHLLSPYSADAPLVVLGHPGSGKSLLTQLMAAHLQPPAFTTVRVELRDVNPDSDIQTQIEEQIRKDTGRDVSWPNFSKAHAQSPPLVILDGYDELLQASGKVVGNYLMQVRAFQRRETVLDRPVRVMVTSRLTLIDKAAVPPGTSILRLLEFDHARQSRWAELWNEGNQPYFSANQVDPFQVPTQAQLAVLAEQPLLLLMLAMYDSAHNPLKSTGDLDQTLLYDNLLRRFIRRERLKGDRGITFSGLETGRQDAAVENDIKRLGVAAIGMFNRRALHIHRDDLDRDLEFFADATESESSSGVPLSPAELLLGSFFFIHESQSRPADRTDVERRGPAAFEFLHNTFGEFLAADFILRTLLDETEVCGTMSKNPVLASSLEQRLESLTPHWFASLSYAPLHSRPVVLRMIREWSYHRLRERQRDRDEFLSTFDTIIRRQITITLHASSASSPVFEAAATTFPSLPLLARLALYTLNMVMLRTMLAEERFELEENALIGSNDDGVRMFDRITHLWRSWLPLESLTGISAVMNVQRDGDLITFAPRTRIATRPAASSLAMLENASMALADESVAGLAQLVLTFLGQLSLDSLPKAQALLQASGIDADEMLIALRALDDDGPLASRLLGPPTNGENDGPPPLSFLFREPEGQLAPWQSFLWSVLASAPLTADDYRWLRSNAGPTDRHLEEKFAAGDMNVIRHAARVRLESRWAGHLLGQWVNNDSFEIPGAPGAANILRLAWRHPLLPASREFASRAYRQLTSRERPLELAPNVALGLTLLGYKTSRMPLLVAALEFMPSGRELADLLGSCDIDEVMTLCDALLAVDDVIGRPFAAAILGLVLGHDGPKRASAGPGRELPSGLLLQSCCVLVRYNLPGAALIIEHLTESLGAFGIVDVSDLPRLVALSDECRRSPDNRIKDSRVLLADILGSLPNNVASRYLSTEEAVLLHQLMDWAAAQDRNRMPGRLRNPVLPRVRSILEDS